MIAFHAGTLDGTISPELKGATLTFLLVLGAFNMLNLLPMYRFDGGQVIRQIFVTRGGQTMASFAVTAVFVWLGWRIALPGEAMLIGLAVFTLLSLWGAATSSRARR